MNRATLDCVQFCGIFLLTFFSGDCAVLTEEVSDEALMESVRYRDDGEESSEFGPSYAFHVFAAK